MIDLATLGIAVDSTQVKTGTASLDGLSAAGARADAAVGKLGTTSRSAGAAAAAMAAQAQASSRAAVGMATGVTSVGMAANNARVAMLDMTHVGINLTTMLASGVNPMRALVMESGRLATALQYSSGGIRGLIRQTAEWIGFLKVTKDAELAETAANAAAAASAVRGAAQRAAANVAAADTEIELALAAQRVAVTSNEATAATARLAAAYEAAAVAARELATAENALAVAQGRAAATAAADAETSVVPMSTKGAVITGALAGATVAIAGIVAGFKVFQAQVRDDHTLDNYAHSLGLTKKEMKSLQQTVGEFSSKEMKDLETRTRAFDVTWGDVWHGLAKTASDALDLSPAWQSFKQGTADAFTSALAFAESAAAHMYGFWVGGYRTIVQTFSGLASAVGHFFAEAANAAIGAIEGLINKSIDAVNNFAKAANSIIGKDILGTFGHVDLGRVSDNYGTAGKKAGKSFGENVADATGEAQKHIAAQVATIYDNIIGAAKKRIKDAADTIIEDRTPKKAKKPKGDHGLADALAILDAQIEGQWKLAAAYQVSDAAAIKAEALQKAEEQAIRHKGQVGIFYEKELALAVAQRAAGGAKAIADMRFETEARKKVNDQVAAGLIPAERANAALDLETALRPLVAAAAVAEGKAKQKILDIIKATTTSQTELNKQLAREQYLREIAANDNDIERLKLEKTLIGASNKERAVAIAQLEAIQKLKNMPGLSLPEQANFIKSYTDKVTAGIKTPLEEWAATIPRTAAAVNEALQGIAVRGIDTIANSLTEVIMGTKSLGQAFKDIARQIIADIIQMTIKMLIFKAISSAFGGGFAQGGVFGGGGSFAMGGAFGGGNVIPFGTGGMVDRPTFFPMSGGRTGVMGEAGPEAVMPLSRDPQGRLGVRAANTNAPVEVVVHVVASEEFDAKIANISVQTVRQAAPVIIRAAKQDTMRSISRPKLMGR